MDALATMDRSEADLKQLSQKNRLMEGTSNLKSRNKKNQRKNTK